MLCRAVLLSCAISKISASNAPTCDVRRGTCEQSRHDQAVLNHICRGDHESNIVLIGDEVSVEFHIRHSSSAAETNATTAETPAKRLAQELPSLRYPPFCMYCCFTSSSDFEGSRRKSKFLPKRRPDKVLASLHTLSSLREYKQKTPRLPSLVQVASIYLTSSYKNSLVLAEAITSRRCWAVKRVRGSVL